jgi:hypothetical protein
VKIETVFMIAALAFMAALAAIAYTTGNKCHEEPPSDKKRVEVEGAVRRDWAGPAQRAKLESVDAPLVMQSAGLS